MGQISYSESAERLRVLLKDGMLRQTDLTHRPERFFEAHRLLSNYATRLGPGFGIRFTVQFNLFAGTILAVGGEEQVKALDTWQQDGRLGCFALTEKLAGVNSGLVVNTTCVWNREKQAFLLSTPTTGAHKNWISQGCTADKAVVIAALVIDGKSYGPHGFVMDLRKDGQLVDGVTIGDMGDKTIGNDLDNAWIEFNNVWLPKDALLNRYSDIQGDSYVQKLKGVRTFEMIGQRLYTGRTVIAGSTLVFARRLFESTQKYSDSKKCWAPKREPVLSEVPQISALYREANQRLGRLETFMARVEEALIKCLKNNELLDTELIDAIAVSKVKCIETAIELCFRLKQEVGSFALMGGTGFEKMDYLNCCKFAEGDSRILMQKIARDRMQAFKASQTGTPEETQLCMELGQALMAGGAKAWDENWEKVYKLSDVVMTRIMDHWVPMAKL